MNNFRGFLCASAAALAIAGCTHHGKPYASSRGEVTVDASVKVTPNPKGGFDFTYDAPFADSEGNFDFSAEGAKGNTVTIKFSIADAPAGLKFKPRGDDAIWIDRGSAKRLGSPKGAAESDQFSGFKTGPEGKTLTLVNKNDDGELYRYGLRFDLGDDTVMHDPDMQNGGGNN